MYYTPFHQNFDPDKVFFSSDWHINHSNLCKSTSTWDNKDGCRDFPSIEEMNRTIIDNTNVKVPHDAFLFNIGDILFGNKTKLPSLIDQINCKNQIYLYGNHCDHIRKNKEFQDLFLWCGDYLEIFVGKKLLCLFHYANRVWNASHKNSYQLYAHSHGSLPGEGKQIDVGVDSAYKILGRYEPFSFKEIDNILKPIGANHIDHHKKETNWK